MTKMKKKQKLSSNKFKRNMKGRDSSSKFQANSGRKKGKIDAKEEKKPRKKKHNQRKEEDLSDFEEVDREEEHFNVKGEHAEDAENSDHHSDEDEKRNLDKLKTQQNRKNKKSGGFQSMGLSHHVFRGITRKGYKVPTPIQRKTVPIILEGKDVVAMARTGSGKTAAFLIPMFEKLHGHTAKSGARAIVLSPTRELALQTLKFTKELGRYMGLRAAVVLGGDRMEDQFAALHENPDIIIATPGRFMHVVVEMNLKLKSVQYVVFDEADRLFEMGFQEQLNEILARLPDSRQTLLFSATLPKLLVEFAKAGLHDPTLIRLDVDSKLSEQLKTSFFQCRQDDKISVLLYLLKYVIPKKEQTVVFVATKHHVEYIQMILHKADIPCTYIYSSLDPTARKISIAKFQHRKVSVMVVTDLAARGIDIPLLDNVINLHFPPKPKLFVHRVGRVARAGRSGTAYTLVSPDEVAYMYDLHLFLGRPVQTVAPGSTHKDEDGLFGRVPQSVIDDSSERLRAWHAEDFDIKSMVKVCSNAFGHFLRSRPAPAPESIKRVKNQERLGQQVGNHPLFGVEDDSSEAARLKLLNALQNFKSSTTIFEVNPTSKTSSFSVMKQKRGYHGDVINRKQKKVDEHKSKASEEPQTGTPQEVADDTDLQNTFSVMIGRKRVKTDQAESEISPSKKKQKRERETGIDEEHFISYRPQDYQTEQGLRLGSQFDREASGAVFDMGGDDENTAKKSQGAVKWDRKKKKFVRENLDHKRKKIQTESGAWISASYKSNAYKDWVQKTKRDIAVADANSDDDDDNRSRQTQKPEAGTNRLTVLGGGCSRRKHMRGSEGPAAASGNKRNRFKRSEIKRPEQIVKSRKLKAKKEAFQKMRQGQHAKNKAMRGKK